MTLEALTEWVAWKWVLALLWVLFGLIGIRLLGRIVYRRMVPQRPHHAMIARTIVLYVGAVIVLLVAAETVGLELTALLATAGVLTVAVGFAAQTSLSNLIAGLFLLVDRPFQVGDSIEIEGRMGVVQRISLLSTYVRTWDNLLVRWPNEVVLKATIVNITHYGVRRVDVKVGLPYASDLGRARQVILEALRDVDGVLMDPAPDVVLVGFLDSGVNAEVRAWVPQPEFLAARTAVVQAVHDALHDAGLPIPFPQLTMWQGEQAREER